MSVLLTFTLSLALHGTPAAAPDAPVEAYSKKMCPTPERPSDEVYSVPDMRDDLVERLDCLKKAMNKELDGFLLPLKKKDPAAFKTWMALQASFNRWSSVACELNEQSNGSDGNMWGFVEMSCADSLRSHRSYFGKLLASGELQPFWKMVEGMQDQGRQQAKETANAVLEAKKDPNATESDVPSQLVDLDPEKLEAFEKKLSENQSALESLAREHCKVLPGAPAECETRLVTYFRAVSGL